MGSGDASVQQRRRHEWNDRQTDRQTHTNGPLYDDFMSENCVVGRCASEPAEQCERVGDS